MRRVFTALLLTCALPLVAQDSARQDTPPKFAFYSLGVLAEHSVKAKSILAELESTKKTLSDKLKAKEAELQKVQQQLQGGSISDQGREALQKQLRDLDFDFKKLQEDSQAEYNKVHQKVLSQLDKLVGPIVDKLAKEQHLQVVFFGDAAQQGQLLYWADDSWYQAFTIEVAKRLDGSATGSVAPKPTPTIKPTVPPAKPAVKKP